MQGIQANNKRIAKNTAFLYLRMLLVLFVSLYTTRVILNALGVEDYGIFNVVGGFVSMFAFLNGTMSNAIQRFYNYGLGKGEKESFTQVYNTALIVQILLAVVLLLLLESIGIWYIKNKMVIPEDRFDATLWVYQFAVISMLFVIMQVPYSSAIIAKERMDFYAYVSLFEVFAKLTVAIVLPMIMGDKLIWYSFLLFLITIISFLFYICYCKKKIPEIRFRRCFQKNLFRSMLSFSGWNVFGTFAYMLKSQGLNVLLNAFFGVLVNSARGVSNMIMSAIQGFQSNIVMSFRPQLVQSYASGDYGRVKNLMYSLSKISYALLFILSLPVIIEIDYILHLWLGDIVPEYTIPFTILVLANMVISSLNTPLSQIVHATGKMKNYQLGTSLMICSIIPISWVVLKLGGNPISVFWVSLTITVVNQILCIILTKQVFDYNIPLYLRQVIWPCVLLTIIAPIIPIAIHYSMSASIWRLIIVISTEIICTGFLTYFFVLNTSEKQLILSFVNRFCKKWKK